MPGQLQQAAQDADTRFGDQPGGGVVNPCPGGAIEIYDVATGTTIAGTMTVVVGKKCRLGVRSSPAGQALSDVRWEIPGETVKSYVLTLRSGVRTDLNRADLWGTEVPFYWVNTGGKTVRVSATVRGKTASSSAAFDVIGPSDVKLTSVTHKVELLTGEEQAFGGPHRRLEFGSTATGKTRGIAWTFTARGRDLCEGAVMNLQLVQLDLTIKLRDRVEHVNSKGLFYLDTSIPYDNRGPKDTGERRIFPNLTCYLFGEDSPGMGLIPEFRAVTRIDNFRAYFMYKPDGADSIWVTLGRLDWGWSAGAMRHGPFEDNTWDGPLDPRWVANPTGMATSELPVWPDNMSWVLDDWKSKMEQKSSEVYL